ncbi:BLUF domain-containing protein [Isoalcanivorax indicus]|uniref:BLUF domain-containing protein n=1 Tax=Isoalcanivorax indicus TaxID=2202653 RepID=UPI000DB9A87A|nr:BLUF domain-containing protein [Isoalcanivorax indicus]
MTDLIQITYISRATFEPGPRENGVEPHVGRILMSSRRNNPRRRLVGVLYYGDGCFFQCIEGERAAVQALFSRISDDPRHTDIRVLRVRDIDVRSFNDWSMKYVPAAREVLQQLRAFGQTRFDPYSFNDEQIEKMVDLLRTSADPTTGQLNSTSRRNAPADMMGLTYLAIALSTLALAVSCVTLAMIMEWI